MSKAGSASKRDPFVIWILVGIPILFALASPLHFVYEWTGKNIVAALFTPVNESPWEHLKLTFWPVLVWWFIGYLAFLRKKEGGFARAAVTCLITELFAILFITAFFYTYTGALAVESLTVDIISLFLGLFFGILLARHVYKHSAPGMFAGFISVVLILAIAAVLLWFTFQPPQLPIFMDRGTGTYGI